jgi:2'-5' RNA ligase
MDDRIRSFIAVAVPPESAESIRAAQDKLKVAGPQIKWVNPDSFHITLKFLGGVEPERLKATWQSVSEALAGARPFTMRFRGVGAFPSASRARVVWVGISEGADELTEIAKRVEQVCSEHGFEMENRPFTAHLTLGRAREPGPDPALAAAMKELAEADLGQAGVDRVLLMRSELTRQGAIYHELEHKLLG